MTVVRLSRRNLLSLLHQLEMQGAAKTLVKDDEVIVLAEPDEMHYQNRKPGPMPPETEAFVAEMERAIELMRQEGRL